MTDNERKYWAFISYSQQDNCEQRPDTPEAGRLCWGNWLHDALKAFSIPTEFAGQINGRGEIIPDRIHPIFQDRPELPEEATLSADVRKALEESICLVVVCSPRSAQSPRVNEVVRHFKQLGRGKHILPVVVAGEPNASDEKKSGSSPADECLVPALRHPVQPDGTLDLTRRAAKFIYVDARHGADQREILANDQRHAEADLEMAKIHLIALLLGVGFNGLWWREQKRHFFDLAEAQHQVREALGKAAEAQQQLQEAQRQTREAQKQALESQNLPHDVRGQIQEAQDQAAKAQSQASEAQNQLQEFQQRVRDTQTQLEELRHRALAAESKILAAQQQAREAQAQLEETRNQAREAQSKVLEIQNQEIPGQLQDAQSQLAEIRQQAQVDQNKFLEAQRQLQEFQSQAQAAQTQLEAARQQVHEAESKVAAAQNQAREAQDKFQEIQNQTRDAQSQIRVAQEQVAKTEKQRRIARHLNQVLAVLAVLTLLAAGLAAKNNRQQRQIASQALARATAEAAGKFEVTSASGLDQAQIKQTLQSIGGVGQAENRRTSLEQLARSIPPAEIPEALRASSVVVNDQQRTFFQKCLLVRLGGTNPEAAMTNASAIEGKIVNDEGLDDSNFYLQLAVLDGWLEQDVAGALDWVCQLPDAVSRQRALMKISLWVNSLPAGDWRSTLIPSIARQTGLFANTGWINSLDLLPETIAPWPWAKFLFNANVGRPPMLLRETETSSSPTNNPIHIQPKE